MTMHKENEALEVDTEVQQKHYTLAEAVEMLRKTERKDTFYSTACLQDE